MHPALLKAYRNTCYESGNIKVHIGQRCQNLDQLLLRHGAREAVFITAYNPFSRRMPSGWNERMQLRLSQALRRGPVFTATGYWKAWSESHFLVIGDARRHRKLAQCFRQNAIVMLRLRQPAKLLLPS